MSTVMSLHQLVYVQWLYCCQQKQYACFNVLLLVLLFCPRTIGLHDAQTCCIAAVVEHTCLHCRVYSYLQWNLHSTVANRNNMLLLLLLSWLFLFRSRTIAYLGHAVVEHTCLHCRVYSSHCDYTYPYDSVRNRFAVLSDGRRWPIKLLQDRMAAMWILCLICKTDMLWFFSLPIFVLVYVHENTRP